MVRATTTVVRGGAACPASERLRSDIRIEFFTLNVTASLTSGCEYAINLSLIKFWNWC